MDYTREMLCRVWLQSAQVLSWNAVASLRARLGGAQGVWDHFSPDLRGELGDKAYERLNTLREQGRDRILLDIDKSGAYALFRGENGFPDALYAIPSPPEMLFVRGKMPPEGAPAIAIVGSRADTRYGRSQARLIARRLAERGVTIVSGLARGIDGAAHEGALDAGGVTIAVLGSGLNNVYPAQHKELAERIVLSGGAIVTELPPDALPLAFHFPLRNRIISGLADALLLVEARTKSGTSSTVNHALDQGREVFALPGNVDAPGSELPLKLLKEGACLCTCAEDILEGMRWGEARRTPAAPQAPPDNPVLRLLDREEMTFEELLGEIPLTAADLSTALTLLVMDGKIERRAGRAYAIKRN